MIWRHRVGREGAFIGGTCYVSLIVILPRSRACCSYCSSAINPAHDAGNCLGARGRCRRSRPFAFFRKCTRDKVRRINLVLGKRPYLRVTVSKSTRVAVCKSTRHVLVVRPECRCAHVRAAELYRCRRESAFSCVLDLSMDNDEYSLGCETLWKNPVVTCIV